MWVFSQVRSKNVINPLPLSSTIGWVKSETPKHCYWFFCKLSIFKHFDYLRLRVCATPLLDYFKCFLTQTNDPPWKKLLLKFHLGKVAVFSSAAWMVLMMMIARITNHKQWLLCWAIFTAGLISFSVWWGSASSRIRLKSSLVWSYVIWSGLSRSVPVWYVLFWMTNAGLHNLKKKNRIFL